MDNKFNNNNNNENKSISGMATGSKILCRSNNWKAEPLLSTENNKYKSETSQKRQKCHKHPNAIDLIIQGLIPLS